MKKSKQILVLIVLAISTCFTSLHAQGLFVKINAGYGLQTSSQNIGYYAFFNQASATGSFTREQINVSFGKGLNFGAGVGYMFSENVGAELDVSYLLGGKSVAHDTYTGGYTDYTLNARFLRLNPSLIISAGSGNISPYVKMGVLFGMGSITYIYDDYDDGDITYYKEKLNGGISFGLTSGIGANFSLSDMLSLFGELNMVNMSYAPKKGEVTEFTSNGINQLPDLTTKQKETEFLKEFTVSTANPTPDSQPRQALSQKMPFGSVGLNIGVKINL